MQNEYSNSDADMQDIAKDLRDVVRRAEGGDASVLPRIRKLLDVSPDIWQHNSDAARHVEDAWIGLMAGENLLVRESLSRRTASMRCELAGNDPTLLERLLVDRIVVSWLQTTFLEARLARHHANSTKLDTVPWKKRLDAAHRRHLQSIRVLAEVRKLLPPEETTPGC